MTRALTIAYVALVILANWLASKYLITVPFTNLVAPAGVLAIGAVLVVRDWLQQLKGVRYAIALMLVAGASSYVAGVALGWTSLQKIAVASVIAFLVSETVEAAVFTPLRRRLTLGVAVSSIVAAALDSWIFLTLAFGSLAFFRGQMVGKLEMIAVGVALTAARRRVAPVAAIR